MKKQTISIFVIVACICILQSCATVPYTTMSANLGVLNSSIVGESESWKNSFGAQGGVTFNVLDNFNKPISARAEVNVSMQGAKYEDDWGEGPVEGVTRLVYLNFPLVARYQLENGFFGEAGIQPGFLLSAKDKVNGETYDYKDWVNKFDLSIPIGVGYEFKNNFGVGLRVIPGITNINAGEGDISKDRNFVVALRGTYTFKKK